jgi:metal-sulfur cluster biosynthetic enzyme
MMDVSSDELRARVLATMNTIVDPCSSGIGMPTGIVDLGLIDGLEIHEGRVEITLITTAPHCMFVGMFKEQIEQRIGVIAGVEFVHVTMNYEAMWDEARMSEVARARLVEPHRRHRSSAPDCRYAQGG